MKSTGVVRKIDDLGRIVIPKEIRRSLRIREGDSLEIYSEGTEGITLRKYSQIENLENMANIYADSFYQVLKYNVIITDTDKIVAVGGNMKKKYINNGISEEIERMMERRDNFVERKKKNIEKQVVYFASLTTRAYVEPQPQEIAAFKWFFEDEFPEKTFENDRRIK